MSYQSKATVAALASVSTSVERNRNTRFKANDFYGLVGKRIFDIAVVMVIIVPVSLFLAVFAIAIATDGRSPFFRQVRVGKNGKEFGMWKLRSMVGDAESKLEAYLSENAAARQEWDSYQKLKNDPRITAIGKIIRRFSIDELPQIYNVLCGQMSLVGPRPMLVSQKSLYPGEAYYLLRPGITGYWQISERNESEFKARAFYDTRYCEDISFATDLEVMAKTVGCVTGGSGC
ncbi:sugar transferase [Litoreibacter janthinus]|uniref:Sugar transferase involved in LPS biosynthesis (Colanic, teichoic acid) n=1 Tax=Litoreibacter janthinus TaxID=670154 RepID=A0A1I6FVK0_9RHOB|nr:sugar transferase [Litoreibacter janthinus]SFR33837.1 Sugar transferase involved in LPS biosynthesis (colanic, teichoic acid) [Litoreibacter janthinus]